MQRTPPRLLIDRAISALLFAIMVSGAVRTSLIGPLQPSWRPRRPAGNAAGLSIWPLRYSRDPFPNDLVRFLESVERETPRRAKIALLVPEPWNHPEYAYALFRFRYLLAGHSLAFPPEPSADIFSEVDYVACWHPPVAPPSDLPLVFSGHDGVLLRGRR
jgi:hypothetical protein